VKILHTVEFYHPHVGGAQEVVRRISEGLVQRGHDVTVATTKLLDRTEMTLSGVRIAEFAIRGNAVSGFEGATDKYQSFLLDGDFDVMMNYAAQQWATDLAFPIVDKIDYPAVVVPCGFSGLGHAANATYFDQMPDVLRRYAQVVFHGDQYRDAEFARRHHIVHCTVIPNGASREEFLSPRASFRRTHGIPDNHLLFLTVGSHTGEKGHHEAIEAFQRAKIGRATLVIVGNEVAGPNCLEECRRLARGVRWKSLGRKRVLLPELSREEIVAAYQDADLFIFPSNIECSPIVLYEAMASRTAFVATACGNAEEIVEWSGGGRIVRTEFLGHGHVRCDSNELARVLEQLARNDGERERLAEAGFSAWSRRFTWEHIVTEYEALYESVISRQQAHTR
jgi:glycosyltransferase involved in cell wall biosynthesis